MTTQLHQEALAEAKKIREIAQKNAEKAIMESIAPKLKEMIETTLLDDEDDEDKGGDADILLDALVDEESGTEEEVKVELEKVLDADPEEKEVEVGIEEVEEIMESAIAKREKLSRSVMKCAMRSSKLSVDESAEKAKQSVVAIEKVYAEINEAKKEGLIDSDWEEVYTSSLEESFERSVSMFVDLRGKTIKESAQKVSDKFDKMNEVVLNSTLTEGAKKVFDKEAVSVLTQALVLEAQVREIASYLEEGDISELCGEGVYSLPKEIYEMAKKQGTLDENKLSLLLKGLPDGVDLSALEVSVEGDEVEGDDAHDAIEMDDDADLADDDMDMDVDTEIEDDLDMDDDLEEGQLKEADLEIELELPEDIMLDGGDVEAEVVGLDSDDDADIDLDDDMDMEMDHEDAVDVEDDMDDDDEIEFSEAMLRQEIAKMRSGKALNEREMDEDTDEKKAKDFSGEDHGPEMEDQFGGGKSEGHALKEEEEISSDEEEEDDEAWRDQKNDHAPEMKESSNKWKQVAQKYIAEFSKVSGKLKEANLQNAKLVYLHKLLENENLKPKQKVAVINALDGAESLQEAKKLFATLSNTLGTKTPKDKGALSESIKKSVGASSKVRSSGSAKQTTLNESKDLTEISRFQELAGIKSK